MIKNLPPMGWNTWNTFAKNIQEELILDSAKALVSSGLKDAGYEYVVIDDCWALKERGADGRLTPAPAIPPVSTGNFSMRKPSPAGESIS